MNFHQQNLEKLKINSLLVMNQFVLPQPIYIIPLYAWRLRLTIQGAICFRKKLDGMFPLHTWVTFQ